MVADDNAVYFPYGWSIYSAELVGCRLSFSTSSENEESSKLGRVGTEMTRNARINERTDRLITSHAAVSGLTSHVPSRLSPSSESLLESILSEEKLTRPY
jgi:hypothetical protein